MVFVMITGQRRRSVRMGDCKCLFEDVPIPVKKRERGKPPFIFFFPSRILDLTPQTIVSTHSFFAHQPVFTVAAYCLNPAGRPGILVLQSPAAPLTGLFY